jgi:hypothetical protein
MPDSFTAVDVPKEVAHRLQYCVPPKVRGAVVERLIEWWDRQVVLSLLDQRSRFLTKFELQARLQELIVEHSLVGLPDEYGDKKPDSVAAETGPVMEQQIIWVKGGNARIQRAAIARWRARNQRDKWLDGDFAAAAELANFDRRLVDTWWGHFGPIKEDCEGRPDDICRTLGLELLEWSHFAALNEIPPIRPHAPHSYIVQGSLQQLAEEGTVGWHPRYKELLASFMSAQRT